MPHNKDPQKLRIYEAENNIEFSEYEFQSTKEIKIYVNTIINSRWWKSHSKIKTVFVRSRRKTNLGKVWCRYDSDRKELIGYIKIPTEIYTDMAVLHMLAHVMLFTDMIQYDFQPHGIEYTKCYLQLIKRYMGKDAWLAMKKVFRSNKIRYRPYVKK